MKHFYLLFFYGMQSVFAQTYHPDKMLIDGVASDYRYHHMETYFNYYPEKRPVINKDSTIISRGYIAEYEIVDQQLHLRDLKTPVNGNYDYMVSNAKKVLPTAGIPLKLHWIDGLFDVGIGQPFFPNPQDSINPIYKTYYVFEIKRGSVKTTNIFSYKQYKSFKDYQWERFRYTAEYTKIYNKLLNSNMDPVAITAHLYHHILFYSKQNFLKKER